jgi:hypothetical protein
MSFCIYLLLAFGLGLLLRPIFEADRPYEPRNDYHRSFSRDPYG